MKKTFLLGLLAVAGIEAGLSSCSSCECKQPNARIPVSINDSDGVLLVFGELDVDHVTSSDRQYMYNKYGNDYRWFEQCMVLSEYLDDSSDSKVEEVTNVFQVVEEKEIGYDVHVIIATHNSVGQNSIEARKGFWVEDNVLNDEDIVLNFEQAYDRAMASNYPKPHSRHCVLRKQVGPHQGITNPQYIFGNSKMQLFVDAVTGDVTNKNPVFGDGIGKPLGEWP